MRSCYEWHDADHGCSAVCSILLYLMLLCVRFRFQISYLLNWGILVVLFAVWKSSGIPAARGRMSLRLYSMNHLDETHSSHSGINVKDVGETTQPRRGWWDYVPENEKPAPSSQRRAVGIAHGFHSALLRTLGRIWTKREDSNITVTRKPSLHSELPLTQLHRPLPVKISDKPTSQVEDRGERSRAHSPIPSFTNYDIWLRPRMVLFREVMRDEVKSSGTLSST